MTRLLTGFVAVCAGFLLLLPAPAHALADPEPPAKCFRSNANGELPSCTFDGQDWSVSYDDGFMEPGDTGVPSGFVAIFVLVVLAGVGTTVWRVSLARQMARDSGMNQDQATAMTLLSDNGLDATYLASNLRDGTGGGASPPVSRATSSSGRTVNDRLRELQQLRDEGLVTYDEYDTRRKEILDSL